MQTYDPLKPISGTTKLSQLYQIIRDHIASLVSNFSGTSYPSTPVVGQHCFRSDLDIEYRYTAASGWSEVVSAGAGLGLELVTARGSLGSLDQRLDVSHNEDGTLKAATSLNPSQWYNMTAASGVVSVTQFKLYGADGTAIYRPTRRLKINRSSGTAYTDVISSSYSAPDTTVVVRDGVISNLISVEHSIVSPNIGASDGAVSYEMISCKQKTYASTTYTVKPTDTIILAGGSFTITGCPATQYGPGRTLQVKNTSTGTIIYDPDSSETVDGSSNSLTIGPYQSLTLLCETSGAWMRLDVPVVTYRNINLPEGYMYNGKITSAVASNNLTVAIKTLAGNDASASDPIYVNIDGTIRTISAALSITLNAGTNWFNSSYHATSTFEHDYFVYLIWNTNTSAVSIGLARFGSDGLYSEFSSTSTNQLYMATTGSAPASTNVCRVVGRIQAVLGLTATFYWSISTTTIIQHPIYNSTKMTGKVRIDSGFSSLSQDTVYYSLVGRTCFVHQMACEGTSNSSAFYIYFLAFVASNQPFFVPVRSVDNAGNDAGALCVQSSGSIYVARNFVSLSYTGWSTTLTKRFEKVSYSFSI
jgi:hypothetical protein